MSFKINFLKMRFKFYYVKELLIKYGIPSISTLLLLLIIKIVDDDARKIEYTILTIRFHVIVPIMTDACTGSLNKLNISI